MWRRNAYRAASHGAFLVDGGDISPSPSAAGAYTCAHRRSVGTYIFCAVMSRPPPPPRPRGDSLARRAMSANRAKGCVADDANAEASDHCRHYTVTPANWG